MRISTENEGISQKTGRLKTLIDGILGVMADFLRLIDVNAGGLRLKKGQVILHLRTLGLFQAFPGKCAAKAQTRQIWYV